MAERETWPSKIEIVRYDGTGASVEFFDVMVALIRKVLAGKVKTIYWDKDFVGHHALQSQVIVFSKGVNLEPCRY